jgi:hypothetical protein
MMFLPANAKRAGNSASFLPKGALHRIHGAEPTFGPISSTDFSLSVNIRFAVSIRLGSYRSDAAELRADAPTGRGPGSGVNSRSVTARVVIYEAFVEGKLEASRHLARTVHDLYFEPEVRGVPAANDLESLGRVHVDIQ